MNDERKNRLSARYASDEKRPVKEIREQYQLWVPDDAKSEIEREFKRITYELSESDFEPEMLRHYHPVLLEHGLDRVREMDADDFLDAVRALDVN